MAKDVALKDDPKALAVAEVMGDMEDMQGFGSENVTKDDVAVPFLKLAQALSPEINKREASYIKGLEQGDFFNSVTQQFWKGEAGEDASEFKPLRFIPVLYKCTYLEWVPRDNGGGLAGEHGVEILAKCREDDKGNKFLPNGNEIIMTAVWFGFILHEDGSLEQAVISLGKTHFKRSKTLNAKLLNFRLPSAKNPANKYMPPYFYHILTIGSLPESNDQGSWFAWDFKLTDEKVAHLPNAPEVIAEAKRMYELVQAGEIKADMSKLDPNASAKEDDYQGQTIDGDTEKTLDGDIPF